MEGCGAAFISFQDSLPVKVKLKTHFIKRYHLPFPSQVKDTQGEFSIDLIWAAPL